MFDHTDGQKDMAAAGRSVADIAVGIVVDTADQTAVGIVGRTELERLGSRVAVPGILQVEEILLVRGIALSDREIQTAWGAFLFEAACR